jgi:hypothetical protein
MELVGREYVFDYGDLVLRVRYLSASRLSWAQLKGPEAGSEAEQEYTYVLVRPGVYFFWWQEKDTSVVSQVVDAEQGRVYTTWVSPDKTMLAFHGSIRRTK